MRNGLIDVTKCQSSERKGNLFQLLCIAHTTVGSSILQRSLSYSGQKWKRFVEFIKLYLAMEEWFHDANKKEEVRAARVEIAKVLQMLQQLFPQPTKTNGYNIPKMHGMTKMQLYIKLFGSGIDFYGGPGESTHKQFIKIPGQWTQRRVGERHDFEKTWTHGRRIVSEGGTDFLSFLMTDILLHQEDHFSWNL